MLQSINPNVVDTLCRLGHIVQVDEAYLDGESKRLFLQLATSVENGYTISRRGMRSLSLGMQRRLWQLMMPSISLSLAHQVQIGTYGKNGGRENFHHSKSYNYRAM